jgi:glycosyltransferase involved in cell wall biosynthesis
MLHCRWGDLRDREGTTDVYPTNAVLALRRPARARSSSGCGMSTPTVSVVMIFLDAARFMDEAVSSVFAQTFIDWELLLVDDGSTDASTALARAYAAADPERVRYLEHDGHVNRGMSASRRLGAEHARGSLIAFLDSDDVWLSHKLEEQVRILQVHPRASMVYGAPLYWRSWTDGAGGLEPDQSPGTGFDADMLFEPPELLFLTAPLGSAPVPCPSDILVRRNAIERVGGSEPAFRGAYEDVALYAKLFLAEPVFVSSTCWAKYRIHPESCMAVTVRDGQYQSRRLHFLNWFEEYLARKGLAGTEAWTCLQATLAPYRRPLTTLAMPSDSARQLTAIPNPVSIDSSATTIGWDASVSSAEVWVSVDGGHETLFATGQTGSQVADWINAGSTYDFLLYAADDRRRPLDSLRVTRLVDPGVGGESFGSLRRVVPVSRSFGFDRGQPIDRHYIDLFLSRHASDVRGRVLEIGEPTYTRRFGGSAVSGLDVLHVREGNPEATVVGDLSNGGHLPTDAFDCILLIQTLQLIFDVPSAIRTLHRILRPGGVVLATFPGLSQRSHDEWAESWYWGFTRASAERLFGQAFRSEGVTVQAYGNVLVTAAFLFGLSAGELSTEELGYVDPSYEILVTQRATKERESSY